MMKKWEPCETNMRKSNNSRMIQKLVLHTQQIMNTTSTQDHDPRPLTNNDHPSVLPFEMYVIESGEPPSWSLTWKPLGFLSRIKCRTNSDRFPFSLWFLKSVFTTTCSEIICIHAKSSPRLHKCTTRWCTTWEAFSVRWVAELKFTRLLRLRVMRTGRPGDKRLRGFTKNSRTG